MKKRLYKNRYRVDTARLPSWDYRKPGLYFVTIVTAHHQCFLSDIIDGKVHLSPIGEIFADEWLRIPILRSNVRLDEWVVMPNHVHGIIDIRRRWNPPANPTMAAASDQKLAGSLGSIVGQTKGSTTSRAYEAGYPFFAWQQRFWDHIIRTPEALERIRRYIRNNPERWEYDRLHKRSTGTRI